MRFVSPFPLLLPASSSLFFSLSFFYSFPVVLLRSSSHLILFLLNFRFFLFYSFISTSLSFFSFRLSYPYYFLTPCNHIFVFLQLLYPILFFLPVISDSFSTCAIKICVEDTSAPHTLHSLFFLFSNILLRLSHFLV